MFKTNEELVLHNINYIDVVHHTFKLNKSIVINNGIIRQIKDGLSEVNLKTVLDCTGLWAIPSFIDTHAHLSFNPFIPEDTSNYDAIYSNLIDAALAGTCLIRDVGVNSELGKTILRIQQQNKLCFPEIVMSGTPLCVNCGHGNEYGVCIGFDEIDSWLCKHKQEGNSWVKIMNDPENHSQDYLNKVVTKAHNIGLKVACHAFTERGIRAAICAEVDTIEHSLPFDDFCFSESTNIYFVPTAYSAWLSTRENFLQKTPKEEVQYLLDWNRLITDNFEKSIKNHCNIITGTDGGCAPSRLYDIKNEVKIFSKYGMSNMQCLCSTTIEAAKMLGKESLYGSISVGKYANIIILKSNPLNRINTIDEMLAILLRGINIKNEVLFQ